MNEIQADRRETKVVLLKGKDVLVRLEPELALELAQDMTFHADKILAHLKEEE